MSRKVQRAQDGGEEAPGVAPEHPPGGGPEAGRPWPRAPSPERRTGEIQGQRWVRYVRHACEMELPAIGVKERVKLPIPAAYLHVHASVSVRYV